jgi:predicted DNA-binding transcriptional regulator AlpA
MKPFKHSAVTTSTPEPSLPTATVPLLLWGWPEIKQATGLPERTLNRLMHRGFPKPVRRVGRRPFWRPADVIAWAEGRWPGGL